MTAASPGVIANFLPNEYYSTEEEYLYALADVMKDEYHAIANAGLLLQIDCPDLAMTRITQFSHLSEAEFKKIVEQHVEVINYALKDIDPERMRLHLCWGKHRGAPPLRYSPERDRGPGVEGQARGDCPSRAPTRGTPTNGGSGRMWTCPRARFLSRGVGLNNKLYRTSRAGRSAHLQLRQCRWPGKGDRWQRLRLWHLGVGPQGGNQYCLGQAGRNVGGRAPGLQATVVMFRASIPERLI